MADRRTNRPTNQTGGREGLKGRKLNFEKSLHQCIYEIKVYDKIKSVIFSIFLYYNYDCYGMDLMKLN